MKPFVVIFHAAFEAEDDASAAMIAAQMVENAGKDLEADAGDEVWVSQVLGLDVQSITPEEALVRLRVARNVLIRTRSVICIEVARELDKVIWQIAHNDLESNSLAGYDYAQFVDLCEAIVLRKENPND